MSRQSHAISTLLGIAIFGCLSTGCKTNDGADVKIVDGVDARDFAESFSQYDSGQQAASSAYVATVKINLRDQSGQTGVCTGTLVAPNAVITAAHCLEDGNSGVISKRKVQSVVIFNGTSYGAASVHVHDYWRPLGQDDSRKNDIAVIKLNADFSQFLTGWEVYVANYAFDFARPVETDALGEGKPVQFGWVLGYGNIDSAGTAPAKMQLKEIEFTGKDPETRDLLKVYARGAISSTSEDDTPRGTTGPGDSGGPAFLLDRLNRAVLVGVTKGGVGALMDIIPWYYATDVRAQYDFLREHLPQSAFVGSVGEGN